MSNKRQILLPQVVGGFGEKKSNSGTQWYQQDRVYDATNPNVISMCLPAGIPGGSYRYVIREK